MNKRVAITRCETYEPDCIISLPKLKTHQLMYYTGAMKNLFGLIPSVMKSPMHVRFPSREGFASMMVDLNTAVMPHYAFMDAIVGMEGPGPEILTRLPLKGKLNNLGSRDTGDPRKKVV